VTSSLTSPFTLAVCAEMVFLDLPIVDRVHRIHDLGFQVEIWDWTTKDVDALAATRATFSSMTGYVRGELVDPDGADELLATAAASIPVAARLGIPRLNLHGTGLDARGLPVRPVGQVTEQMWPAAARTLSRVAALGEREGVVFCLENLNTAVDHPGTPFARAADTLALVSTVDHPHLRLMLDLYHAQIGEGNLIELARRCLPYVGEIQVADVPGRCEPGTGEIAYPVIARALADAGYTGTVGLEAFASGDSVTALERFRAAFTV
jgi:hydroxypyruvate isomerase